MPYSLSDIPLQLDNSNRLRRSFWSSIVFGAILLLVVLTFNYETVSTRRPPFDFSFWKALAIPWLCLVGALGVGYIGSFFSKPPAPGVRNDEPSRLIIDQTGVHLIISNRSWDYEWSDIRST